MSLLQSQRRARAGTEGVAGVSFACEGEQPARSSHPLLRVAADVFARLARCLLTRSLPRCRSRWSVLLVLLSLPLILPAPLRPFACAVTQLIPGTRHRNVCCYPRIPPHHTPAPPAIMSTPATTTTTSPDGSTPAVPTRRDVILSEIASLQARVRDLERELHTIDSLADAAEPPCWNGLSKRDIERFGRQMLIPSIGSIGQQRLKQAKVLIVGLGGIGSPVALLLAAGGIGSLGIVDDDVVSLSNLHRQLVHSEYGAIVGESKVESALHAINRYVRAAGRSSRSWHVRSFARQYVDSLAAIGFDWIRLDWIGLEFVASMDR